MSGLTRLQGDMLWSLVVDNMALCGSIAQRFKPLISYITIEELVTGPGMSALIRCARSWDKDKGKFLTYAWKPIYRSMARYISVTCKKHVTEIQDTEPDVDAREKNEAIIDAYNILSNVPEFDRIILLMRYWQCKTLEEIGTFFGCSKTQAYIYIKEALEQCRQGIN